jgi:hypothetical protein
MATSVYILSCKVTPTLTHKHTPTFRLGELSVKKNESPRKEKSGKRLRVKAKTKPEAPDFSGGSKFFRKVSLAVIFLCSTFF